MKCSNVQESLTAYIGNEVTPAEKEGILQHLKECPVCRAMEDRLRTTWNLAAGWKTRQPSEELVRGVYEKIRKQRPEVMPSPFRSIFSLVMARRWYMKKGFIGAVAVIALVLVVWLLMPAIKEEPLMASAVTSGALQIIDKEGKVKGTCPLKHTEVRAEISGYVARVNVIQEFINPFNEKIEAVYVFPLSADGAVDDMVMKVGKRTIRAQIKKREEARAIYEEAKAAGKVASLLDQERPNIFTQSVANIMPGESVTVTISYVEVLKYEEGEYSFVFPMVVGPRYMPGSSLNTKEGTGWSPDTTQVPDASKISPPVAPPETRAGHDISIAVSLNAGLPIKRLESKLHEITTKKITESKYLVSLKGGKTIPNKDFILSWAVAGDKIEDALLTNAKDGKGFFTLILHPPQRPLKNEITPKEMVFVLDCSGSMDGYPIETAKKTMELCIKMMNEHDTFNIIGFACGQLKLFDQPQPNTRENQELALKWLRERTGGGGTEMLACINAVLDVPEDPNHLRIVCFMTDGYVGNDMEILGAIKAKIGNARLFSFGIGHSVNRFLLDNMAQMGRGEVDYVTLNEPPDRAAERFHERIACPLLTDISLDWGNLAVTDIYPKGSIPDLFAAKPLILKGRYTKAGKGEITLKGKLAGREFSRKISVELPQENPENNSLSSLWARAKIDDLMGQDWSGMQDGNPKPEVKEQITHLGLEFRLMTQFTSFVAVEELVIADPKGGEPRTIAIPVEMPEGVSYERVFGLRKHLGPPVLTETAPRLKHETETLVETPADKIKVKLDESLQGLAEKVAKEGKNGNLTLKDLEVKDGKIEVKIFLKDTSAEILAELKKLGVRIIAEPKVVKMIIGEIEVTKLNDLALLDFVVLVTPLSK